MTEQETASSLFDEVKKLQVRVAFLEMALDQAIELTGMEFVPSHDRMGRAVPERVQWDGGETLDNMTHVEQLGFFWRRRNR